MRKIVCNGEQHRTQRGLQRSPGGVGGGKTLLCRLKFDDIHAESRIKRQIPKKKASSL